MRFLSNTHNPEDTYAKMYFTPSYNAVINGPTAVQFEWEQHLKWINSNIIGPPKATEKYTTEELEKMGLVGIYSPGTDEIERKD